MGRALSPPASRVLSRLANQDERSPRALGGQECPVVLHEITANGKGTQSQSLRGAIAKGASGIALRGLTVGSTLVLIDT